VATPLITSSVGRVVEVRPKNTIRSILKNLLKKKARKQKR